MTENPIPQRIRTWLCTLCGHRWIPRKPQRPVECPKCRRRGGLTPSSDAP